MQHYTIIDKVKVQEIPEAKTLNMAFYQGMPFAVSKNVNEDDLYVIFLPDGQLSEEYAEANDCVEGKDENGKRTGGFFGKNRKVRAVKFMQGKIRSLGYIAELDSLAFTGANLNKIEPGTELSELNGVPISNKFVNEKTKSAQGQRNEKKKRDLVGFDEHKDTNQFYNNYMNIFPGDIVTVTEKLDGTSVRAGQAYEKIELKWYHKLLDKIIPIQKYKSVFLTGTRRVVLKESNRDTGFYENDNIYQGQTAFLEGRLSLGESFYGEIVGWQNPDKALFRRGGVTFKYGTQPGERKLFIYHAKHTLPDGSSIHLPWQAVKERAEEVGAVLVPVILPSFVATEEFCAPENLSSFFEQVGELAKGQSTLDQHHIREGVVVRIDRGTNTIFYKCKSEEFYALEDNFKNDENNVDIEEAA